MMWHVVFTEPGRLPQSRAARSRDAAIKAACELLALSYDVRRILETNGMSIERAELDEHYDQGRFPGLRIPRRPEASALLGWSGVQPPLRRPRHNETGRPQPLH